MTMLLYSLSFHPRTVRRVVFYTLATLVTVLMSLPSLALLVVASTGVFDFWLGLYLHMAVFCTVGLAWAWSMNALRRIALRAAVQHRLRRLYVATNLSQTLSARSERAEWRMLAGLCLLFGLHITLSKPAAQAQVFTRNYADEHAEPRVQAVTAAQLAAVRQLQVELHLNEHGVQRALKYLRQGYALNEVRNLFAAVVRK